MTNRDWPPEHRTALAVLMAMIIATAVAYFFVLRPKAVVVEDIRNERDSLLKELGDMTKDAPYPLDAVRLNTMSENAKAKLNGVTRKREEDGSEYNTGLIARSQQVLERATGMFDERIKREYTDISTFMNQVSRIVYRDELDELKRRLAAKQIILDEEVLGIGENTEEEIYQLMLKVWTVDRLVNVLVEKNGLAVENRRLTPKEGTPVPRGPFGLGVGGRVASEITVLPTRFYILHKDDPAPYVMELPIRVRVQGPLPTICNAIRDLQANGNFLTVNRMVLETENPLLLSERQPGSDGFLRTRNVVVTLEISSYFRPSGHAPTIRTSERPFQPRGA